MTKIFIYILLFTSFLFSQTMDEANKLRLAQSYESNGNFEKALELFKELYQKRKDDFIYYDGYLKNLVNLKQYNDAIVLVNSQLKKNPADFHSLGLLAVLYYKIEKLDSMNFILSKAYSFDKTNPFIYRTLYNILIENRLFDKAIDILEEGKMNCTDKVSFMIDLVNLYSITMNYQKTCETMVALLLADANHYYFVENKLSTIIHKNEGLKISLKVIGESSEDNNNLAIDRAYAWLLFASKDYKKAFELILKIDEKSKGNGNDILNFAQRAFNEKEFEVAIESYNYILKKFENRKEYRSYSYLGLAKSYEEKFLQSVSLSKDSWKKLKYPVSIENTDLENAITFFNKIIDLNENLQFIPEAIFRIAKIRKDYYNNFSSAKSSLENIIMNFAWSDFNIKSLFELGKLSSYEKKYDVSNELFSRIKWDNRSTDEEKANVNYYIAVNFLIQGKIDTAKSLLTETTKNIYLEISNDILELLFYIQESENSPENLKKFILAKNETDSKNYSEAGKLLSDLTKDKSESSLVEQAFIDLADVFIANNDFSSALSNLQYVINLKEKSLNADEALYKTGGIYYFGLLNYQQALDSFEKILINYPNSLLLNQTRMLIEEIKNNQIKN